MVSKFHIAKVLLDHVVSKELNVCKRLSRNTKLLLHVEKVNLPMQTPCVLQSDPGPLARPPKLLEEDYFSEVHQCKTINQAPTKAALFMLTPEVTSQKHEEG